MNGKAFKACIAEIVGADNADLYAGNFGDLDDKLIDNIYNYEGLAFYVYTTSMNWHYVINRELWSDSQRECIQYFRDVLNGALAKLPVYRSNNGTVYRGYSTSNVNNFLYDYSQGAEILFPAFTSAAYKETEAFGGNALFIIRSLTARAVWHLSANFGEYEVLIPAGREFKVLHSAVHNDRAVIVLEELP